MGKTSSDIAIVRLRRRARDAGISIRVRRASKSHPERAYDLIEKATGRVLSGGVSLAEIEPTLDQIAEERADASLVSQQALPDPSAASMGEAGRFCEWCGKDQAALRGGLLETTPDGLLVCSECARSMPWSVATERASRRRPLVGPLPLRDGRGGLGTSTGTRRWMSLSAAVLGLATLVVAMQQPAFQDPNSDGGVLDARATPPTDLGTAPASPLGEPSLAPASSAPLASGSVGPSPVPPSTGSSAPSVIPTGATAAPRSRAATPLGGTATPAPVRATSVPAATSRAPRPQPTASPAPTPTTRPPTPSPPPTPTPTPSPPPEPTDAPPTPVITPSPEPDASDAPGPSRVHPSPRH